VATTLLSQPFGFSNVNYTNPISNGLIYLFNGVNEKNCVTDELATKTGAFSSSTSKYKGISNTGTAGIHSAYTIPVTTKFTVLTFGFCSASGITQWLDDDNFSLGQRCFQLRSNAGVPEIIGFINSTTATTVSLTGANVTNPHVLIGRIDSSGAISAFHSGGQRGSAAQASANFTSSTTIWNGDSKSGSQPLNGTIYMQAMWNRALSDTEINLLLANPWQLFSAPSSSLNSLAGIVQQLPPLTNDVWLTSTVVPSGNDVWLYTTRPAASNSNSLSGVAANQSTATGIVSVQIPITAAAVSIATDTGAVSTTVNLSGSAQGITTDTGAVSTSSTTAISGSMASITTDSGVVNVAISLSGAALAQAIDAGVLSINQGVAGSATGITTNTGAIQVNDKVSGNITGVTTNTGTIGISVTISGAAIAQATDTGVLSISGQTALSGAALAQSTATGVILTQVGLSGNASAVAQVTGGISTIVPISGLSASISSLTGNLTISGGIALSGQALSNAVAAGVLNVKVPLSAAAISNALAAGLLTVPVTIIINYSGYSVFAKSRNYKTKYLARDYITLGIRRKYTVTK
jgi:hypothetical protein